MFPEGTSFLKLGLTYPLPMDLIRDFAKKVEKLYIIEELDPFMEDEIKAAGIDCVGKELTGKLDKTRIREFYGPSVPVMLRETGIAEQFIETTEPKIHQYLADAITTHINRELYFAEKK